MPTCALTFYSQHGTTARVAERIADGLRAADYSVDLFNIKTDRPTKIDAYDLVGVGSPVYFCAPPVNVQEYLASLPPLPGIPAFAFVLHGSDPGDVSTTIRRTLARRGAKDLGFFRCFGAEVNYLFVSRGYLFSPDHPTPHELALAEAFGREVADRAGGKPFARHVYDGPARPAFRMLPYLANRWTIAQVFSRLLWVAAQRCNGCGLCVRLCPLQNISIGEEKRPVWGRRCLFCTTCILRCPQGAIVSALDWRLMGRMLDAIATLVVKDPTIEHARVALHGGRIQRLADVETSSLPGSG